MCGIIGYVGKQQAAPILLDGLRRLEYRGYDSAGLAIVCDGQLKVRKRTGKINDGLGPLLDREPMPGVIGLGHTRWATHGAPTDENAHPHWDHSGRIAVVHNGIIENYERLKQKLKGHKFKSSTDTEVLAHLIGQHYEELKAKHDGRASVPATQVDCGQLLTQAVINALKEVVGAYGIGVVCLDCPGVMVGARRGSPLIVGVGEGEHFLASDASALAAYTRQVVYLNDYDVVTVTSDRFNLAHTATGSSNYEVTKLEFGAEAAERGAFEHYMLKEIFEQPRSVENALRGRIDQESATAKFGGLNLSTAELRAVNQIVITACGTSWHAGLIGEYLLEELAHVPVEVEYASEFRYRNAPLENNTLVLAITQSGETADTLASLRETRRRGHKVLGICNVVGSTIAREADGGIYLHAGPEIGVASTKAFTSQVTVMTLLAVLMGRMRMLSLRRGQQILTALEAIPKQMEQILGQNDHIRAIAEKYKSAEDFFFLGRQYNFPVALEGALKLKEISYIHAEGYPAAEMKHGPIALIDQKTPSVVIIPTDSMYDKTLSNLQVVKARKGPIIAVATEADRAITKEADDVIYIPQTAECLVPLLSVVPLQLLAYHIAVLRGCDVDKPRNLAKSVTVE
ncbi:MAG TPA: glutamine--fructose-6-phosphate transaminase (isomerizing) [Verrucomicrobiae bacterium]|nr:glutamine--fructose-6-phosphate transaminase (isomerizing) [Verrucomicrobiae bacterium]